MTVLYLGILIFTLPHLFSTLAPAVRDRLKARFGEKAFKGTYAALSWIGLIAVAYGYWVTRGNGEMLYVPGLGARHATLSLATLGFILIGAGMGKSHLRLWLQNPFSIGVALWYIGHLIGVGKTSVDLIYLMFLVVAVADIIFSMARGKRPDFAPVWSSDVKAVVIGLVLTAIFVLWFHPYVLGVYPLGQ